MIEYSMFSYVAMFVLYIFGAARGMGFFEGFKFFVLSPLTLPLVIIGFLKG